MCNKYVDSYLSFWFYFNDNNADNILTTNAPQYDLTSSQRETVWDIPTKTNLSYTISAFEFPGKTFWVEDIKLVTSIFSVYTLISPLLESIFNF